MGGRRVIGSGMPFVELGCIADESCDISYGMLPFAG